MRTFLFFLLAAVIGSSAQAAGPCPGGQCHVAKKVVRTTTKTVTAPVRVVRRVFGR